MVYLNMKIGPNENFKDQRKNIRILHREVIIIASIGVELFLLVPGAPLPAD